MAKRTISDLNLLLAVDKPQGCTSHDVVARARRAVSERRIGHAGTLDPLASGVMVLGLGQGTRLLGRITQDTKSYIADVTFGFETNTDDAEGEPTRTVEPTAELFDAAAAARALASTVGPQMQVPPAFSAISVGGVRSYKRARAGDTVELPARPIEVRAATLISVSEVDDAPVWTVAYTVSKGTYIRALARDLGRMLDAAAHVSSLRRTASGSVTLASCVPLDDLSPETARAKMLDPVEVLGVPAIAVEGRHLDDIACGRKLPGGLMATADRAVGEGDTVALVNGGALRALGRVEAGRIAMSDVFPQPICGVRP
ncbi:tRNA pseudouridine(55) synthase TruB [Collinsella ihumii]|uniref:tRNA pseudouridine synthase B n=1 Tax=Collinsella ihumii TaxID=1720204 RepID=A0AAW7JSZ1_9ACTN|nr:tRNA pseudouridine(55) synthase TruB [Collinsella ihumii]MDN0068103.1 tRNA pseudouridine(55) synthase TruB [Collinsella ihumii]